MISLKDVKNIRILSWPSAGSATSLFLLYDSYCADDGFPTSAPAPPTWITIKIGSGTPLNLPTRSESPASPPQKVKADFFQPVRTCLAKRSYAFMKNFWRSGLSQLFRSIPTAIQTRTTVPPLCANATATGAKSEIGCGGWI